MHAEFLPILAVTAVLSFALTWLMRRNALAHGLMDIPNERSSHVLPTPRGGGVAIVTATTLSLMLLWGVSAVSNDLLLALGGGGLVVAVVGYFDDRYRLSARVRLAVHFVAALWALWWLGGLPQLQFGTNWVALGWMGYLLGAVGIVWSLNLFNFMDGIDGIAASEAIFVTVAGALVACLGGAFSTAPAAWALAAGCAGFLCWNWPKAKIFMGDAGSGYLGYAIAVLAIATAREQPVALLVWVILGAVFFVDATITLVRRVVRRERVSEAHRSHAYQWLSRRWDSHLRVTVLTIVVNLTWLLPCAWFAARRPHLAMWILLAALLPVAIGAMLAGAGRKERTRDATH